MPSKTIKHGRSARDLIRGGAVQMYAVAYTAETGSKKKKHRAGIDAIKHYFSGVTTEVIAAVVRFFMASQKLGKWYVEHPDKAPPANLIPKLPK